MLTKGSQRLPRQRTTGASRDWYCVALSLLPLCAVGCNWFVPLAFVLPEPKRMVQAEYAHLGGKVAVVVWTSSAMSYNYPNLRLDVAGHVSDRLQAAVPELQIIDVWDIEDFLKGKPRGRTPEQVGRHFETDHVIYLEVLDFALRDPSSPEVVQGRMYASVVVYGIAEPGTPAQRTELAPVSLTVPEGGPTQFTPGKLREIRKELYATFGATIANKFREYEEVIQ